MAGFIAEERKSGGAETAASDTAILPGGIALGALLAGAPRGPWPEGVAYVLNPVTVGGRRAWLDFGPLGPAVLEERFPSETYAEFALQHHPELGRWLDALRATPALLEGLRALSRGMAPPPEAVIGLAARLPSWYEATAVHARDALARAALARRGPARTLAEAAALYAEATANPPPLDRPSAEFVALIEKLVARRNPE